MEIEVIMEVEPIDVSINENELPEEWRNQAEKMLSLGTKHVAAQEQEDAAKAELAQAYAEIELAIREDPDSFGLSKVTEKALEAVILCEDAYKEALTAYQEARSIARLLRVQMDALQHRKSALQGMTDLFMRQWFNDPKNAGQPASLGKLPEKPDDEETPKKTTKGRRVRKARDRS